jgi:excinuclease ABC subunit C
MRRPDLKSQLSSVPTVPGIYEFFDDKEQLLYVGKAKNLRNRVRSYFHDSALHPPKVDRLVARVARLDWIVTESELEALLLEMNLIKSHQPRFNVVLRDDKRYPFIKIHLAEAFPKVEATRKVVADGSRYFGPYASAGALYDTLDTLRKVFPYLTCDRTITGHDSRACLYFDICLCSAPCIGAVDQARYMADIHRLVRFLVGEHTPVLRDLKRQM